MIAFLLIGLALLVGVLWICIAHDAPEHLDVARRFLAGLLAAIALAGALSVPIVISGCNDVEKYSLLWYVMGCFIYESSS